METLDYNEAPPQPARYNSGLVWNVLTAVALLGVVCVAGVFLSIYFNPQSALNPFPPPTLPAALAFPTATPTPRVALPATWTPSPTIEPSPTATDRPTATLPPTSTPFSLVKEEPTSAPADNANATSTPKKSWPFVAKGGKSVAIANIAHPEAGCDWMGVAGRVFDLKGAALQGQQVQLGGYLPGSSASFEFVLTLTGLAPQYGPGYYEFTLSDHPIASGRTLWIQLLDQQGLPLSDKTYFTTYEDCDKNMILLDFEQVR